MSASRTEMESRGCSASLQSSNYMAEQSNNTSYGEVAEQIYNLVDNDQDKINAFLSAKSSPESEERGEIERWFDNYVKPDELNDLMKKGQSKRGLVKWLADDSNNEYLKQHLNVMDSSSAAQDTVIAGTDASIARDIEDEDDEIYNGIAPNTSDVSVSSNKVNDPDEIDAALKALEDDPDIDVTFELVDLDDGGSEDDGSDDSQLAKTKKSTVKKTGKKKVHLNHSINRLVKKIDDEEVEDRKHHEKYYVAKRAQLGGPDNLDKLEDELDKQMISYYDFPHVSIKMYESNEVKMNRIFKKLGFSFRCKDIAKYTKNWHAK